jgi:hypothetical protein
MARRFNELDYRRLSARRPLTVAQILDWADAYHAAHGRWPVAAPVVVAGAPGESWDGIDRALRRSERRLSGHASLARLLAGRRASRGPTGPLRLRIDGVLAWADAYHAAHGRWPVAAPVPVDEAPEESWLGIDQALRHGGRGLPGRSSLAGLLARRRGTSGSRALPPIDQILAWADAYHAAHGQWPVAAPVPVPEAPGETWDRIDRGLRRGARVLSAGSSLARLLAERRGAGNPQSRRRIRAGQILAWADAYHAAHGCWPVAAPVAVAEAPEESWDRIDRALRRGERGLAGGSSLALLLADRRGERRGNPANRSRRP